MSTSNDRTPGNDRSPSDAADENDSMFVEAQSTAGDEATVVATQSQQSKSQDSH